MNDKIMELIQIAMQFKGNDKIVSVSYSNHTNGVYAYVQDRESKKTVYSKDCYLGWENAKERLDSMKAELLEQLEQTKAA